MLKYKIYLSFVYLNQNRRQGESTNVNNYTRSLLQHRPTMYDSITQKTIFYDWKDNIQWIIEDNPHNKIPPNNK